MDILLFPIMCGVILPIPPLVARLILSTFSPKFWSCRIVRWSVYSVLIGTTYALFKTLFFYFPLQLFYFSNTAEAGWHKELYCAEWSLARLVILKLLLDIFFPFVIAPTTLVAMTIYTLDRSPQRGWSKS
jgi:hypothetical protein